MDHDRGALDVASRSGADSSPPPGDDDDDTANPSPNSHAGHQGPDGDDDGYETEESLTGIREPTDRIPLLSGLRRDMLIALESYRGSYLGICKMLDRVAADLEANQTFIPVSRTVDALRSAGSAYTLLHAIPPDLLASIIRGTVAYDFLRGGPKPKQYSKKTGGTYVVAISVEGRRGEFMSPPEMNVLAANIDKYVAAYDDFAGNGNKWDDGSNVSLAFKRFVSLVDRQHGNARPDASPRFIERPANREATIELARMFRRRASAAAGSDKPQIQSPLMVGCNGAVNTVIEDRVKAHDQRSGLAHTTRTWALTLCLMSFVGLVPVVTSVAVLPTWERKQLPLSERLVTALAQSLVTQDGFNIDQPGNHADQRSKSSLFNTKRVVVVCRPWFRDNLKQSIVHMNHDLELVKIVELLQESGPKSIPQALLNRSRRTGRKLQELSHSVGVNQKKLVDLLYVTERENAELKEQEAMFRNVNVCSEEIYGAVKARKERAAP
jgi:hypothetical protein